MPGLHDQLDAYLAASGGIGDSSGLYVLNFGANDVYGINTNDIGALTAAQAMALVISEIVGAVTTLDAIGAGSILVMGMPFPDPTALTIEFGLQAALDALEPTLSVRLFRFSYGAFYDKLLSDPSFYGLPAVINTSTPCLAEQPVIDGKVDCTGYFSFDGVHFTTQVHRAMATEVEGVLGVPEPATWGLMIAGFGMMGAALRRRTAARRRRRACRRGPSSRPPRWPSAPTMAPSTSFPTRRRACPAAGRPRHLATRRLPCRSRR